MGEHCTHTTAIIRYEQHLTDSRLSLDLLQHRTIVLIVEMRARSSIVSDLPLVTTVMLGLAYTAELMPCRAALPHTAAPAAFAQLRVALSAYNGGLGFFSFRRLPALTCFSRTSLSAITTAGPEPVNQITHRFRQSS